MQPNDDFRGAVEDALMMWGAFNPQRHADAKTALNDLICIEQKVALDPSVSAEAQELQRQGVKDCRLCEVGGGVYYGRDCARVHCVDGDAFKPSATVQFWKRKNDQSF